MARATVLAIGGSDSSGGAGVSRDVRTLTELDVHAVAVVTAVTAQTNTSVRSIHFLPSAMIRDQIATALASNVIRAIKIGMLGTRQAVEAVVASLPMGNELPIVLDPVLAASSGRSFLDDDGRMALIDLLFPRVTLITPNIPEAAALLGGPVAAERAVLERYGKRLLAAGPRAVLLKGGHAEGDESVDLLICPERDVMEVRGPRLPGGLRGTGCALSSAIAASLSRDVPLPAACWQGRQYVKSLFERAADGS